MATTPEEVQQQPRGVQKVIERITAPVSTTAPQPFAGVLAAILLALAFDRKR